MGSENPGKLWNFILAFHAELEIPGKRLQLLESPGNLLKSSSKVFRIYVTQNLCRW